MSQGAVDPDTKDWTWVLARPCPDCGFAAEEVTVDRLPEVVRDNATTWEAVLERPDVAVRAETGVWSVLEYACHIRDVHRIFDERIARMLTEQDPRFAHWDQDETAVTEQYGEQDPAVVSAELLDAAEAVAERYESVPPDTWGRRGYRSDGAEFTVEGLGRYHLHDIVHHAWDVRGAVAAATVEAYDADAAAYRDATASMPEPMRRAVGRFGDALPAQARVLEIGSGGGRDARALEEAGLSVRRTDVSAAFVELVRSEGHDADVVDPLCDDLADPARPGTPYDAVWANAALLHVVRADLPAVLRRLAEVTVEGGLLRFSVKEGDGESWSVHGHVAGRRHFTFWREDPLRAAVADAGWVVEDVVTAESPEDGERWLEVWARRA